MNIVIPPKSPFHDQIAELQSPVGFVIASCTNITLASSKFAENTELPFSSRKVHIIRYQFINNFHYYLIIQFLLLVQLIWIATSQILKLYYVVYKSMLASLYHRTAVYYAYLFKSANRTEPFAAIKAFYS